MARIVDVTASSSLDSMALKANDGMGITMLNKALDVQTSAMAQLLRTLPSAPQADNKGTLLDVMA